MGKRIPGEYPKIPARRGMVAGSLPGQETGRSHKAMVGGDDYQGLKDRLLKEEDQRVLYLQGIVDTAVLKIMNAKMTRTDALNLVLKVRALATELFPDDMNTFDLIYMNRFKRMIDQHIPEEEE